MHLDTFPKKTALASILAYGSVVWLSQWHQFAYSAKAIQFPPFSSWLRDTIILMPPILLVIWLGTLLTQRLTERFGARISGSTRSILTSGLLAVSTSLVVMLIENNGRFGTGIGTELVFLASICRLLYPDGNWLLGGLQALFPAYQATRYHLLLQDGFNLMLVNLAVTTLVILALEGIGRVRFSLNRGVMRASH